MIAILRFVIGIESRANVATWNHNFTLTDADA